MGRSPMNRNEHGRNPIASGHSESLKSLESGPEPRNSPGGSEHGPAFFCYLANRSYVSQLRPLQRSDRTEYGIQTDRLRSVASHCRS